MYNTISINPAYAGSRETLSIVGLHRSQWVGVDGAPTTQTLSIHSPIRNDRVGVGMSFINDQLGYENFSYLYGDFSYTLPIGEKTKLAFGIKGGVTHYKLDQEILNDPGVSTDPFFSDISGRWNPNLGLGAYLHTSRWYLGLSAPRILRNDFNKEKDFVALERVSYYFTGGYVIDFSKSVKFKPAFLVKATNGAPVSYDLTGNFLFNEKFWLGASYRINEQTAAIGGIVDFQVSKQLRVGYAYEHPISELRAYTGGTHEILLIYEVFNVKRIKSPRYF
jgi:type IX secretion system PorP/SprF family membrane protein